MSGDPTSAFVFAALFVAIGAVMALFPNNPMLQVKDLGKQFGGSGSNTRLLGIVLILLGLLLIGMGRLIYR
jgi:hypothetical protein